MKKNMVVGSIFGAALLLAVSFVSAVGYSSTLAEQRAGSSPLFAVRMERATHQQGSGGIAQFLGKGALTNLFPSEASRQEELIQTAVKLFQAHPALLASLVKNLDRYPFIAELLAKRGVSTQGLVHSLQMMKDNPGLFADALANVRRSAPDTEKGEPLGLSTSNPLGCFIVAMFALVPVTVALTLLLLFFTLRVLTCMNFNNCANVLAQQIWTQLIQGLTQG